MSRVSPEILVIAGPNGAGKSTCISRYLPEGMPFLNADEIAKTLPRYPSSAADMEAGLIVLKQMAEFESRSESFAFETTLATRSLATRITRLRRNDYRFHLVFVWSPSADFSIQRVAWRVRSGGHDIPEETIRRRYLAGLRNFFSLYQPIADIWDVLDNSHPDGPRVIASGKFDEALVISDGDLWTQIQEKGKT
jgi:predicted ABC-type ATPase